MKKIEKEVKHGDLTQVEGTYGKVLLDNKVGIENEYSKGNLNTFKKYVYDLVSTQAKSTPGQKKFLMNVMKQRNSSSLLQYCWDAILSAQNLKTI